MHVRHLLALVLVASVACTRRDDTRAGDASATAAEVPGGAAPLNPRDEVPDPSPPALEVQPATRDAPARPPAVTAAPESLPAWVPDAGRLTIVEAKDLPRNLGLVDAAAPLPAADAAP
jgi:hypothetical protein